MNPNEVINALEAMMRNEPAPGSYVPGTNPLEVMAGVG